MPTLMVSVSGIRGLVGDGLDPKVITKYASAYADFCGKGTIVVGRDSRITGEMVKSCLIGTLLAKGNDVVDIGICPTPTVLYNVKKLNAVGGIQISASHNPNEWNALKLLNRDGEFMTPDENKEMLELLDSADQNFQHWDGVGKLTSYSEGLKNHIDDVMKLELVDLPAIKNRKFKVLVDCVNGAGAFFVPEWLESLGCEVVAINSERTGIFPKLPEPIPQNLKDTVEAIKQNDVDLGIVVDPDVDRLVLLTEKGEPFIEENTITHIAKFILSKTPGNAVVNLSTTRAIDDVAEQYNSKVLRSPVGEANVVKLMKETDAVIGGEGSGGVIYPALHYGRDALVGIVLTLQHLLEFGGKMSELKESLPQYFIAKDKIQIEGNDPDTIIEKLKEKYSDQKVNTDDGLRIDLADHWIHFRKSNTEPIIRCITEAKSESAALDYLKKYFNEVKELMD
ncbi:MAG: phosphoglucosamine mutase [Melioribacteraceae bacterium]|nr:phosphoglucosamine mutase [Melioribacteraceae bacterium]MCF8265491.1 phosphoglucosamine mutase [Melioribacteraceae bacterium]MCF8413176.1 phosphoglucosamine mutase [Melioribacteraceae bacterium]MCF8431932.1 phosphoglucosamine mutase [Melioribacteraceae bacterium]